jgi:hypothetical protein
MAPGLNRPFEKWWGTNLPRQFVRQSSKSVQKCGCEFYWRPAGSIRLAAQSILLLTIAFADENISSKKSGRPKAGKVPTNIDCPMPLAAECHPECCLAVVVSSMVMARPTW